MHQFLSTFTFWWACLCMAQMVLFILRLNTELKMKNPDFTRTFIVQSIAIIASLFVLCVSGGLLVYVFKI